MITHTEALKVARMYGSAPPHSKLKARCNDILMTHIRALPAREKNGEMWALACVAWEAHCEAIHNQNKIEKG